MYTINTNSAYSDPGGDEVTLVEQQHKVFVRLLSPQVVLNVPGASALGVPGIQHLGGGGGGGGGQRVLVNMFLFAH